MDDNHEHTSLDGLLDEALKEYSNAEPRSGLENRIMSNLRIEQDRQSRMRRWWWIAVAAVAVTIIAAAWVGGKDRDVFPGRAVEMPLRTDQEVIVRNAPASHTVTQAHKLSRPARTNRGTQELRKVDAPRLEQFPSPRPLSPQELAFAHYAQRFPKEAMLMEQEQRSFEEEKQRAQQDARNRFPTPDEER